MYIFLEFMSKSSAQNAVDRISVLFISYIDSVKHFLPNIQTATVTKEALRTFVYHEILIGYLDFIKKRGFSTCYIWACPPLKGDDYIFHCHPKTQKTPKPEKLRQWYHSVIGKAANENIVVDFTSFYNHFFNPTGERDFKITAVRLPCFEGDYCSRAIEDILTDIEKKCPMKTKPVTKRTLQFMGHKEYSDANTKDILFMQKLEQAIIPVKEDFLVIHLHYVCTHCHEPILSGIQWSCSQCKNFHLCERCHDLKQDLSSKATHTSNRGEEHMLSQVPMNVPTNMEDEDDDIMDNNLFENRQQFLSFCQKNHYQFDTIHHAKHSPMIILYYLRNPDQLP